MDEFDNIFKNYKATYSHLTEEMKKEIEEWVRNFEIDDTEGMSGEWTDYVVDGSPKFFEPNEDEYLEKQKEKAIEYIKADGSIEYIELITQVWDKILGEKCQNDVDGEEYSKKIDEEVIKFIEEIK